MSNSGILNILCLLKGRWQKFRRRFSSPHSLIWPNPDDIPPDAPSEIEGFVTTKKGGFPIVRE